LFAASVRDRIQNRVTDRFSLVRACLVELLCK
jgi:hypothetical protein